MQKNIRILVMLLAALLALAACPVMAETAVPEVQITLPVGTRFYPKASFPQLADYRLLSQPEGADVSRDWSWLRLEAEGSYLLGGLDGNGDACMNLRIHAVQEAPALLSVHVDEAALPAGLKLQFDCNAPYSFSVSCEPGAEVRIEDTDGALLGVNTAEVQLSGGAAEVLLCMDFDGESRRIPAQLTLAYPCTACGESPLTADYNAENHVVGYCGHWLCLEIGDLHNHRCVCGEYLCNGRDHSACACPGCGRYMKDEAGHAKCSHCGLRVCDDDYGDPARHIPCPHCGDVYCTLGWTGIIHEQCPHCGLWPCDDGYGYPFEHQRCPGCGMMGCSDAYRADPYAHTLDPYCGRYICESGHPAACPYCNLSPCNPFYDTQDHASICSNCGRRLCAREHGFCEGCGKQLCDADFHYSDHGFCRHCDMRICDPAYAPAGHADCSICGRPLCRGDHSACTAAPEPTVEPTIKPTPEPEPGAAPIE